MNVKYGLENKRCHDLRNKQFGLLRPIKIDSTRNRVYWICLCECGKTKSIAAKHLVGEKIKSCGCIHHRIGKDNPCWRGCGDISGKHWWTICKRAKTKGMECNITPEMAWGIFLKQERKCALTGLPLTFNSSSDNVDGNASLDRIDSSRGYIVGNVWWVDKRVNTIKWDLTLDTFLKVCKLVVDYNKL